MTTKDGTYYYVVCDSCGESTADAEVGLGYDGAQAEDAAIAEGWEIHGSGHDVCPDCVGLKECVRCSARFDPGDSGDKFCRICSVVAWENKLKSWNEAATA